jgi:hypothetical protein
LIFAPAVVSRAVSGRAGAGDRVGLPTDVSAAHRALECEYGLLITMLVDTDDLIILAAEQQKELVFIDYPGVRLTPRRSLKNNAVIFRRATNDVHPQIREYLGEFVEGLSTRCL